MQLLSFSKRCLLTAKQWQNNGAKIQIISAETLSNFGFDRNRFEPRISLHYRKIFQKRQTTEISLEIQDQSDFENIEILLKSDPDEIIRLDEVVKKPQPESIQKHVEQERNLAITLVSSNFPIFQKSWIKFSLQVLISILFIICQSFKLIPDLFEFVCTQVNKNQHCISLPVIEYFTR